MLNVGVYGLGGWGKRLVAAVQGKSEKIRVVACAARTRTSVEQFARDNAIDIVDDYATLLKDPRVQGVILATPHSLHPVHVQQAARAACCTCAGCSVCGVARITPCTRESLRSVS